MRKAVFVIVGMAMAIAMLITVFNMESYGATELNVTKEQVARVLAKFTPEEFLMLQQVAAMCPGNVNIHGTTELTDENLYTLFTTYFGCLQRNGWGSCPTDFAVQANTDGSYAYRVKCSAPAVEANEGGN